MSMQPEQIKVLIEQTIPEAEVYVESNDGTHFQAVIVSSTFEGKTRIQKQQMVYAAVNPYLLDGSLHALSTKAFTPAEWQNFIQKNHAKM